MKAKIKLLSATTIILASVCIAYSVFRNGFVLQFNLSFFVVLVMTIVLQLTTVNIAKGIGIDMSTCFIYLSILTQPISNVYIIIILSFLIARLLSILLKYDYYVEIKLDIILFYNMSSQCIVASITYPFVNLILNSMGLQQILALFIFVLVGDAILTFSSYLVGLSFGKDIFRKMYLKIILLTFTMDYLITSITFLLRTSNGNEGIILFSLFILLMNGSIYNVMSGAEINKKLIRDGLTKSYNRHYLEEHINNYLKQKKPFTLLFFDLDDFKTVNDTYGHLIGDKVLVASVDVI